MAAKPSFRLYCIRIARHVGRWPAAFAGNLHGGAIATLIDVAAGTAAERGAASNPAGRALSPRS